MNQPLEIAPSDTVDPAALRSLAARTIVFLYARYLAQELVFREKKGLEVLFLKSYLSHLFTPEGKIVRVGWEGYSQRLALIIEELRVSPKSLRILDAGCGYGTESLLFSFFPSQVCGVDLVTERIAQARSRIDFFQSLSKRPLDVTFVNANIFRFLEVSPPFDIIWALEAISHIYPPEKFFHLCREKLKDGGKLIVSDPNELNPLAFIRSMRIRGGIVHKPHQKFSDPETRRPVDVGQEKIFNIFRIRKLLEASGFQIKAIDISGFMGSSVLPKSFLLKDKAAGLLGRYQRIAQRIPILRSLGSIYTLVATKRNS
jgi:SAM-dependent methyltransferase